MIKPAMEWCLCEAQEMSKILVSAEQGEMKRLVLLEASEGHYTAGTKVPCIAPPGSVLIPRQYAEHYKLEQRWKDKGDDRDLVMLHLRDVMCFIPPRAN